jgi:O-antigen/teichoic acid export membrane protein
MMGNLAPNQDRLKNDLRDVYFRTGHLHKDLGGRSARGTVATMTAQMLKFLSGIAATVVLARLLTPQDYGLAGMVVIFTNFAGMFQYLGLSTATVRWPEISHQQVSVLFWINLTVSTGIMLVAVAAAPLLAWVYHEPRLISITVGYALAILFTGMYIQHYAILVRQMRFSAVAIIEVVATLVGLGSAIVVAVYGAGVWALVLNQLVMTLVEVVGVWIACKWRPGLPKRGTGIRSMLSYGGNLTGFNVMTYCSRNLDNALIGKFWGAYQLGLYSKAYQMLLMPMDQINGPLSSVTVPALSRLADSPDRYRTAYLKILEKIAMVTMPGVAFMIATSDWLVLLLLGADWRETGRIFTLLGMAAIFQPVARAALWLFLTQGRTQELFRWGLIEGSIAMVSIAAGLPWGATGVAASYALANLCLSTPLLFWYVGRKGPVNAGDFYRTIAPGVCSSLCSLVVLLICRQWLDVFPQLIIRLGIAFGITVATSLLVLFIMPAGRRAIRNSREMLLMLLKRERESVV